jgi:hypothetical protein
MLMMCVFYNAPLAFERNKKSIQAYLVDRGYGGYLKREQKADGTFEENPGFYAGAKNKEELFTETINFINMRGHQCKHLEYIVDCLEIKGYEDLTNRDRFAAVGWALLGSKSSYGTSAQAFKELNFDWSKLYEAPYRY